MHGVRRVVDVRTIPKSRHNPQFNRDRLSGALHRARIHYSHLAGLGGLRPARRDSPNVGWRNASTTCRRGIQEKLGAVNRVGHTRARPDVRGGRPVALPSIFDCRRAPRQSCRGERDHERCSHTAARADAVDARQLNRSSFLKWRDPAIRAAPAGPSDKLIPTRIYHDVVKRCCALLYSSGPAHFVLALVPCPGRSCTISRPTPTSGLSVTGLPLASGSGDLFPPRSSPSSSASTPV
jgi:uncharacterized protein DUF488